MIELTDDQLQAIDQQTQPAAVVDRRTGQQPTLGPRMARTGGLVIGVEEVGESRVENPVFRLEPGQDESLEEPGGMREVPLCGADVRHRLDRLILGRQIGGQRFGLAPYVGEPLKHDITIAVGNL